MTFFYAAQDLQAIHSGHSEIKHHDFCAALVNNPQRLLTTEGYMSGEPPQPKPFRKSLSKFHFVVNNKNLESHLDQTFSDRNHKTQEANRAGAKNHFDGAVRSGVRPPGKKTTK